MPHSCGGSKYKIRVPAWLGSGESPLLGCRVQTFVSSLGGRGQGAFSWLFYESINPINEEDINSQSQHKLLSVQFKRQSFVNIFLVYLNTVTKTNNRRQSASWQVNIFNMKECLEELKQSSPVQVGRMKCNHQKNTQNLW